MPPIPGIPLLIQLQVKGKWATGENTVDNLHFQNLTPGPFSVADLTSMATFAMAQWVAHVLPVQASAWSTAETVGIDRSVADGNVGKFDQVNAGGVATAPAPINTSVLGQWLDSVHYRGGHPRTYLPGLPAADTTDGVNLTAGSKAAWQAGWQAFLAAFNGQAWGSISFTGWRAAHYRRNNAPLGTPFSSSVTTLGVATELATQRRRLRKAAHH